MSAPPTATPVATSSVDAASAALERLNARMANSYWTVSARQTVPSGVVVDGVLQTPTPPPQVADFTGQLLVVNSDYFFRIRGVGDNPWVMEYIHRADRTSTRLSANPWAPVEEVPRLLDVVDSIRSLKPDGEVNREGQVLTRYRATLALPLEASTIWHQDAQINEVDRGTLTVLADAFGAPVAMLLAVETDDYYPEGYPQAIPWRTIELELAATALPRGAALPKEPGDLEPTRVREHGLTMGLPEDFVRGGGNEVFAWYRSAVSGTVVVTTRVPMPASALAMSPEERLGAWANEFSAVDGRQTTGVEPTSRELVGAGANTAMLTTYLLPVREDGAPRTRFVATFMSDAWCYAIIWESPVAPDFVDRYTFERVLETVVVE